MWNAIILFLQAFPKAVDLFEQYVAAYKADAMRKWSESLQTGLQPLEQGKPTTDAQKAAAVKAVADAWKNMP